MISEEQCSLMQKIYETGLAMDDIILYLDTHTDDADAFAYYQEIREKLNRYKADYSRNFAPLTFESVYPREAGCGCPNQTSVNWTWLNGSMPWEGEI
jgi:spore coat protein JB